MRSDFGSYKTTYKTKIKAMTSWLVCRLRVKRGKIWRVAKPEIAKNY